MRYRQAGTLAALAMLALVGGACGLQGGADVAASAEPSFATSSLPCRTTEQTGVIWDYPGPGAHARGSSRPLRRCADIGCPRTRRED